MRAQLAVIVLLASTAPVAGQPPSLEPVAFWPGSELVSAIPVEAFDAYGVALHDLGTGRILLLAMNDNARLYAIDPLRGEVLAELTTPHPGDQDHWWTRTLNGVALGDMDGDQDIEILVLNTGGTLTRFETRPAPEGTLDVQHAWSVQVYAPAHDPNFWEDHPWLTPSDPANATHLAHGHAFVARPEPGAKDAWVYAQSDDLPGVFAFDSEGTLRWMDTWHDGHAGPWVGDLAPDMPRVALFATDAGHIVARHARTGQEIWVTQVPDHVRPGGFQVPPGVFDLDGDGDMELLAAARVAVPREGDWMQAQHAHIMLLDHRGEVLWSTQHPEGNPMVHAAAHAADVQGDGVQDLILLDWNTIGRKPGGFERLGPGNLFALDGRDGSLLWSALVDAPSTDHDFPVADFTGRPSVLVPHKHADAHGVAIVDLTTGAHVGWTPLPVGWSPTRGVAVADLDGDGLLEAIVRLARPAETCIPKADVGCREGGILVYRTGAPVASLQEDGAHTRNADPLPDREPVAAAPGAQDSGPAGRGPPTGLPMPVLGPLLILAGALVLSLSGRQRP